MFVGVDVRVGVLVDVGVRVGVPVSVGVRVGVSVGVAVGVGVAHMDGSVSHHRCSRASPASCR